MTQRFKVADFYLSKQGSRYLPIYVTPESNATPVTERWIVLSLEKVAFLDFTTPQKFVTLPISLVDKYFLGVERDKDVD